METPDAKAYLEAVERRQRRWATAGSLAGWLGCLAVIGVGLFVSCNLVSAGDARVLEAIRASGLRDPRLGGADFMACATGESSRHFTATSALGKRVEGTACCGLTGVGKGCTIRWGRHTVDERK
jgi:hypothetical protein